MPKFRVGDRVAYCGFRDYASLHRGDIRDVKAVRIISNGNELITLFNPRSPIGTSDYPADQFKLIDRPTRKKEPSPMYKRAKFFAVKLNAGYVPDETGLIFDPVGRPHPGDMSGDIDTTPLRDTQHEVRVDVSSRVQEGEKWLVVKTICLYEGEPPRPPIKVTEYK